MDKEIDAKPTDRAADAYEAYYPLLRFIAERSFRVPPSDVRPLIHDVFVSFIRNAAVIGDDRRWLAAAVSNACRNYWRDLRPSMELAEEHYGSQSTLDSAMARHDVAALLDRLSAGCQSILRLRYLEGLAPREIAARYGTSTGYVRLKVHRCLEAARRALRERA